MTENNNKNKPLFMIKLLIDKLNELSNNSPLIEYIYSFEEILGLDQIYTTNLARRLGFDLSHTRYEGNITIREILFYEIFFYIEYYERNRKKLNLPDTKTLINMKEKEFEDLYKKTIKGEYKKDMYLYRSSIMTDYVKYGENSNIK